MNQNLVSFVRAAKQWAKTWLTVKRARQILKYARACGIHYWHWLLYRNTEPLQATRDQWFVRVSTCRRACDQYDPITDECLMCECIVSRKAKWLDFDCPKDLWDKSVLPSFLR